MSGNTKTKNNQEQENSEQRPTPQLVKLTVDGIEVILTHHAIDRYQERIRPGLSRELVIDEILKVVGQNGQIINEKPSWFKTSKLAKDYLMVGNDVLFVLGRIRKDGSRQLAVTCCCRHPLPTRLRHGSRKRRLSPNHGVPTPRGYRRPSPGSLRREFDHSSGGGAFAWAGGFS